MSEILDRSFGVLVPFAVTKQSDSIHRAMGSDKLVAQVRQLLMEREAARFKGLFSNEPIMLPRDFGTHQIRLPLNDSRNGQAGDIVSAWSTHPETVMRHMLKSMRDIISVRSADTSRDLHVFVLRPHPQFQMSDKAAERISDEISFTSSALRAFGVGVTAGESPSEIAEAISSWRRAA